MEPTSTTTVTRRRRPRRLMSARAAFAAVVVTPGLLLGGGLWAASPKIEGLLGVASASTCRPAAARTAVAPRQDTYSVNVYNAAAAPGAARDVARELTLRKFRLGAVGNDPGVSPIDGVGTLRHGPKGLDQALAVRDLLLPGATLEEDYRVGTSVDLVLGPRFRGLAPTTTPLVRRDEVTVDVYNTTYFEGLGAEASRRLTAMGFRAGKVGTDPQRSWIQDTAAVRYGPDALEAAKLVQEMVPGSRLVLDPSAKGSRVALLIGMTWRGVLSPYVVAPEPPKRPLPRPTVVRPCP